MKSPAGHGWSTEKMKAALDFAKASGSSAIMIVQDGLVVDQFGDIDKKISSYSVRKSLISALYGIYSAEGVIDITQTLEQVGIDDNSPRLTKVEKQARIVDRLRARSGVYHPVDFETQYMIKIRPQRGSHPPGTFWYYNNWDFNVLGTILEKKTGLSIGEAFYRRIAVPVGMQDFRPEDVCYMDGPISMHRACHFEITARDMARFGLLYLRKGRWGNKQIIPEAWVEKNSHADEMIQWHDVDAGGYENLWWLEYQGASLYGPGLPAGTYVASGAGVHIAMVIPSRKLVIVSRVDNDPPKKDAQTVVATAEHTIVSTAKMGEIVKLILAAHSQ
ncbi:MAG TPA: serine hydrolase [Terriglobales bacterium]|jgi:CubicO group peptidase (beta-lactamase class C family)